MVHKENKTGLSKDPLEEACSDLLRAKSPSLRGRSPCRKRHSEHTGGEQEKKNL